MYILTNTPTQLKITGAALATAVLLIALLAVTMSAGGPPALAATETPISQGPEAGGGLPQEEQQTTPEACSDSPVHVVTSGHYGLFDVYWDNDHKNLVSNPCPPEITTTTETITDGRKRIEVTKYHRAASNIHIGSTIFHIPGAGEVTLRPDNAEDHAAWPFMYRDARDANGNGTFEDSETGAPLATKIWTLPECEHDPSEDAHAGELCIGFSTSLLKVGDWSHDPALQPEPTTDPVVAYEFESIREADEIAFPDQGYVFGYKGEASDDEVVWDTYRPDSTAIEMEPNTYDHLAWAFTAPGTYRLEVQVKGHPDPDGGLFDASVEDKDKAPTVTSEVRRYTFHVGLMADLAVTVSASDAAPTVDTDIELTVTASNAGPDDATNTEVTVDLPQDLAFVSADLTEATENSDGDVVWNVGALCATATADCPSEKALTVTATVGANTHGQDLETTAAILARETIGSSEVLELDPYTSDNTGSATVTPVAEPNQEPMFLVERSVPENAHHDLEVGDPVTVSQGDDDALTYQLIGEGADKFYAETVAGGAQIKVYGQAGLDYETVSAYNLVLGVSDGKDADGNADSSIDNSVAVKVSLQDIDEAATATLAAQRAGNINTYTYTVTNLPLDATQIFYRFALRNTADPRVIAGSGGHSASPITDSYTYGSGEYVITGTVKYVSGGVTHYISTNSVNLTIP